MSGGTSTPAPSDNWAGRDHGAARTLGYSSLAIGGRPGSLLTMGILSIVFGSLGLLLAAWQALSWITYLAFISAGGPFGAMGGGFTAAGAVTPQEAQVIADGIAQRSGMTAADTRRLAAALPLVDLPLAPPADGNWTVPHVTGQITGTNSLNLQPTPTPATNPTPATTFTQPPPDTVSVTFNGGSLNLDPAEINVIAWGGPEGLSDSTVDLNNTVIASSSMNLGGFADQSPVLLWAGVLVEVGLFLLAGLLLAAGIVAVRGRPMARTLHLWWAPLKILLSIATGVLSMLWFTDFFNDVNNPGPGFTFGYFILIPMIGGILIGCAYPVAVLLMLRTRRLREYFA